MPGVGRGIRWKPREWCRLFLSLSEGRDGIGDVLLSAPSGLSNIGSSVVDSSVVGEHGSLALLTDSRQGTPHTKTTTWYILSEEVLMDQQYQSTCLVVGPSVVGSSVVGE